MRPSPTLHPSLGLLLVMGALGLTQACVSRSASTGDIEVDCATDEEPTDGAAEAGEDEDATPSADAASDADAAASDGSVLDGSHDADATEAGLDAMALGNHEFDHGPENVLEQFSSFGDFDLLAANYEFEDDAKPFAK